MRNHKKAHSRVNGLLQCFTVLILKDKTMEFRITCIMLILEIFKNHKDLINVLAKFHDLVSTETEYSFAPFF